MRSFNELTEENKPTQLKQIQNATFSKLNLTGLFH